MGSAKKLAAAVLGATLVASASLASAAITTTFGEAAPSSNIIVSHDALSLGSANAWFNDGPSNNGNRLVSESFTVPSGPDYNLDKISMRLDQTLASSFTSPSGISVDLYEVSSPLTNPVLGTLIAGQVGTMQPDTSTATAGTYFTFDMDSGVTLDAGKSYAYVLGMDNPDAGYKILRLNIPDTAGDGARAWQNTNGGGWVNTSATYTYYIQGTPVPEPAMGGLLLIGLGMLGRRVRRA